ncbi:MAG: LytTR family transcriptional regulator [Cyclobacteriaceae bacterium]
MNRQSGIDLQKLGLHLLYWIGFVMLFTLIWGTYDHDYARNFMVQVWSMPARLTLVYVTLWLLVPRYIGKEQFFKFCLLFLFLMVLVGVAIQRPIMLFIVEGTYLPYHSEDFFSLTQLTNTIIDVGIAAVIPLAYKLYDIWRESKSQFEALLSQNQQSRNDKSNDSMMIKEGSVSHRVSIADIVYIESLRNYLRVKSISREFKTYGSIASMQQELPSDRFIRIHRSFIINADHLESFSSKSLVVDGTELPIGRKFRDEVEDFLSD